MINWTLNKIRVYILSINIKYGKTIWVYNKIKVCGNIIWIYNKIRVFGFIIKLEYVRILFGFIIKLM